jgi:hypothetical protein
MRIFIILLVFTWFANVFNICTSIIDKNFSETMAWIAALCWLSILILKELKIG